MEPRQPTGSVYKSTPVEQVGSSSTASVGSKRPATSGSPVEDTKRQILDQTGSSSSAPSGSKRPAAPASPVAAVKVRIESTTPQEPIPAVKVRIESTTPQEPVPEIGKITKKLKRSNGGSRHTYLELFPTPHNLVTEII